jgi:small subunit ribosomal protein S1
MHEKNYDPFFDDNAGERQAENSLLQMIDAHGKKPTAVIRKGARVNGSVVRISTDYVFADIGAKNEAIIKIEELKKEDGTLTVAVGDPVEGFIISDSGGEVIVSTSLSGQIARTTDLVDAMNEKMPVQGKVTGINKGGLQVKVMGHRAFCPVSQIEINYVEDVNVYLNRTMEFVITRISEGGKNIVLSRIPLLEGDLDKELDSLSADVKTRTAHAGEITRIAPFGLFVRIGLLEGLVHISEASWDRLEKLDDLFSAGQKISVVVLGIEKRQPLRDSKIALSIKQATGDPWSSIADKIPLGSQMQGIVTRLADFGAFVRLMSGIEGLVHVSEMSWGKRVKHPRDVVAVGQTVGVTVLAVNQDKKTISLSLKDAGSDPWLDIQTKLPLASVQKGTVASRQSYGYFIDLVEGITGLLAMPNIAPEKKNEIKVGQPIEVKIEKVDAELRRISLSYGMAQAAADEQAFDEFQKEQTAKQKAAEPESAMAAAFKAAREKKKK